MIEPEEGFLFGWSFCDLEEFANFLMNRDITLIPDIQDLAGMEKYLKKAREIAWHKEFSPSAHKEIVLRLSSVQKELIKRVPYEDFYG